MKHLALSKNCGCWHIWIIYCIVGTHGNLILFVKRNEEIDQIVTLDQLNDEFERVVKEWKMMMVKMMERMNLLVELLWLVLSLGIILDIFSCNFVFGNDSDILWWLLVILDIMFLVLGGIGKNIDFANFIVFEGCLGCIGVNLLWLLLSDMLVLFAESRLLLPMESELKRLVCRNVLYNLDFLFVICRVGAGCDNVFNYFFYW